MANIEGIKVIGIGGIVSNNQSTVGYIAEKAIANNFFATKFFFSSKGISAENGILESNEHECAIKRQMLVNSSEKYYLCDSSKIGRVGFYKLSPIEDINYLVTEAKLDGNFIDKFNEHNVKYIYVE